VLKKGLPGVLFSGEKRAKIYAIVPGIKPVSAHIF